jgi:hypothetical protein
MRGLCYSIINRKFAGGKNGKTRDSVTPGFTGWPYRGVIARRFKITWAKKEVNGKNTPIPYISMKIWTLRCPQYSRSWALPPDCKSQKPWAPRCFAVAALPLGSAARLGIACHYAYRRDQAVPRSCGAFRPSCWAGTCAGPAWRGAEGWLPICK